MSEDNNNTSRESSIKLQKINFNEKSLKNYDKED